MFYGVPDSYLSFASFIKIVFICNRYVCKLQMIVAKKYAIWCRVILLSVCDIINDKILFINKVKIIFM